MTNTPEILNQALAHHTAGRLDDASVLYRSVLDRDPSEPNALHLLGAIALDRGDHPTAVKLVERALDRQPHFPEALATLSAAKWAARDREAAIAAISRALELEPRNGDNWIQLARLHVAAGDVDSAIECLDTARATNGDPDRITLVEAFLLRAQGHLEKAADQLEKLVDRYGNDAELLTALGTNHFDLRHYSRAQRYLQRAVNAEPGFSQAHALLGNCKIEQADIVGAMESFHRSHNLAPFNEAVYSSYLFYLAFHPKVTAQQLFEANRDWGRKVAASTAVFSHARPSHRPKKLKIGYLSYEFGTHVTSYFFEPVISRHNPSRFDTVVYAGNRDSDATTERLRQFAGMWRDVGNLNPADIAGQIHSDGVDILALVSSYRARHRLALAYKPAPVQVCYHNLVSTTGIAAIDYMITEDLTDPGSTMDAFYVEKLVKVTNRNCYLPPDNCPDVSPPPAETAGHITFGTFNNIAKITPDIMVLWGRILANVPGARLLIKNINASDDPADWQSLANRMAGHGIPRDRVDFLAHIPGRADHLAAYNHVDIALDTFPCNGGTTSCDALWMGVPVVTLAGDTFMGRQGLNYLTKLDLPDLIARDGDGYVDAAVNLARDDKRRAALRRGLRELMRERMLDYDQHVAELEAAYDVMWNKYLAGETPEAFDITKQRI